jgi:chloride channel protein, CIC family
MPDSLTAHPDETLRELARRLADEQATSALVVEREDSERVLGHITSDDLLQGHLRDLVNERDRERILRPRRAVRRAMRASDRS